jgi:hypothetical protein
MPLEKHWLKVIKSLWQIDFLPDAYFERYMDKRITKVDEFINWCKNHKLISVIIIIALIVIGFGKFTDALNKIHIFFKANPSASSSTNNGNINFGTQINNDGKIGGSLLNITGNSNVVYVNGNPEAATKEDIAGIQKQLRELQESLKPMVSTNSSETIEGYSLQTLVSIRPNDKHERKYIVDTGTCALFLDANNALLFAVKDSAGEEHSIKLDASPNTFLFDHFIFLSCDAGYSNKHSVLRIRVNGIVMATSDDNYNLQLVAPLQGKEGPAVGTRKDGSYPGDFTMLWLSMGKILTNQQNLAFMKIVLQFEKDLGRTVDLTAPPLAQ